MLFEPVDIVDRSPFQVSIVTLCHHICSIETMFSSPYCSKKELLFLVMRDCDGYLIVL